MLGVLGFSVSQRIHEFGVRLALGAQQGQVLNMILREGAVLTTTALVVGGITAAGLSRFLAGLLFEIEPTDPATFVGVGVLLGLVALAASFVPARRATRVDPMVALRSD